MDVQPTVKIDTCPIKRVKYAKVLGVEIDENLNWEKHIEYIASKVSSGIGALKKVKEFVDRDTLGADHWKSDGGGGGGGGKSKNKNRSEETEKKIRSPEKFEKTNRAETSR
jgi:hypothetical protein